MAREPKRKLKFALRSVRLVAAVRSRFRFRGFVERLVFESEAREGGLFELRVVGPVQGGDKRDFVIDQHDRAEPHCLAYFTSGEQGNADTAVASGFRWNIASTMDRHAAADVVRVVN